MNFGPNLYNWLAVNAQSLVLVGLIIVGVVLLLKREISKFIGLLVAAIIAVLLVFNTAGVKDVLLELGNKILGI